MTFYHWLGREAAEPICDGDFTEEDHIEDDGFITVYCSGPIRPLTDYDTTQS